MLLIIQQILIPAWLSYSRIISQSVPTLTVFPPCHLWVCQTSVWTKGGIIGGLIAVHSTGRKFCPLLIPESCNLDNMSRGSAKINHYTAIVCATFDRKYDCDDLVDATLHAERCLGHSISASKHHPLGTKLLSNWDTYLSIWLNRIGRCIT